MLPSDALDRPASPAPLTLVAGVARDGAIGHAGGLLWRLPEDLARFRRLTTGGAVLMGRRTWDSLPPRFRPLPGRLNLVVTRQPAWRATGAIPCATLAAALAAVPAGTGAFVIGGAELYASALPQADVLELTEVDAAYPAADTRFPEWPRAEFVERTRKSHRDESGLRYDFVRYERRR